MRTSANRRLANAANARRSTGPRSAHGKARASRNAFKHGLAVPAIMDAAFTGEARRLAAFLAGEAAAAGLALELASASLDVLRARRAGTELLSAWARRHSKEHTLPPNCTAEPGLLFVDPEAISALAADLMRLERYERRSASRRDKLAKALLSAEPHGSFGSYDQAT